MSNALHDSPKRDEELTKALKALGTVFTNMLIVHLEDRKAEWLKIQEDKEDILECFRDAYEIRDLISNNYMLPEYQQGYLEFTDLDTIRERFENHKILRYIYRNRSKQWIALSAIVQNRDENGRVTDIQFLTHDVTDQRERELQQEDALRIALASAEHANKAKTAFLNNMSHDIRTPMNAIIGFTALSAAHMDQPDLVKDYLTKIGTSSQHLLSLINDVLDMPKMDGYMTTREIRTLKNNKKANIPIIAMTANAFEEDKKKALKAGMNAHIAKPIDIKTILAVFDQVFGNL